MVDSLFGTIHSLISIEESRFPILSRLYNKSQFKCSLRVTSAEFIIAY